MLSSAEAPAAAASISTVSAERGSSGSPVFNDQWEIVALHHAGVPAPGHDELGGIINEGVRVSRLLAFLRDHL